MAHAAAHAHAHEEPVAPGAGAPSEEGGWLVPLVLLLATTAFTVWALLLPRPELAPPRHVAATWGEAAAAPGDLGVAVERVVSPGVSIRVPERGVEGRLLAFIRDAERPVDRETWFDFDRLTFDTASATLRPESQDQLAAVTAILVAFPAVKLKLGGYTDAVGDAAANQALSARRADSVRAALIERGVAPERLTAEGYGAQFPVADNATEEGRARNRRISMRVIAK
jgi:outer membrane protein OmpA-like peptidoglycan-associated protein